ncbi:hypothetical protein AMK59_7389 [Oryctes borbonicus]|uniref:DH domain-containing protein n=1 Tax=Oryctes borbonicus TaxID=1629725 RepID=A0A0T6ATV8_9SCAR|nr:hypothetical protein AMK59_7389 [Oryctes borbonicus]
MERRHISRGERNRSLSVKALRQMFEELIRLTQTAACSTECACRHRSAKYPNGQNQDSEINSEFTGIIRSKEKLDGGQNAKPAVPSIDGSHVKNRKLFFEEQAHVLENTKKAKYKTEINITPPISTRYSTPIDLRSKSIKDTSRPYSVKSKKELFEGYINGNDHKVISSKSTDNLHYRPKHYDDYEPSSSNLNGYIGGQRSNTMSDLLDGKYDEIATRNIDICDRNTDYNGISSEYNLLPDQYLTNQTTREDKFETSSDEDDRKDFIEYQHLPPPPTDLLKSVQNDELYQNLFPQLYDVKLVEVEGDVDQESDDLKYVQNLFVYFLRTDDAKESEIEPIPTASIVEIQDDVKEGNLIDIIEENEIYNPGARNVFDVSTATITPVKISSCMDETEPIYSNVPSSEEERPKQEIIDVEDVLKEAHDESSINNIEEYISDVTEAFQSIQTLCDQPKWTIWDMAKQMHRFQEPEDECDIFGTLLDIDSDYCTETFNNGEENVLFRISIGREVLLQESEDYSLLPNETFYHEVDPNDTITYEEPEYYTIGGTTYDSEKDVSGIFFDKNKNPRIEIIGGNKNQETSLPQLSIPKLQYMIIRELIDSEENYLKRMKYIIDNYLIYFRSMNISSDIEIVFGNIEEIYIETEKIYLGLKGSFSVDEVARVFLANAHLFDCYTEYLRNKSIAQQYANKSFADIIKVISSWKILKILLINFLI